MRASELQTSRIPLLARLAALFAGCVTAGLLFAPSGGGVSLERRSGGDAASTTWRAAALPADGAEVCRGGEIDPAINEPSAYQARLKEEVQQLLAQGGCPGWMALASETDIVSAGQRAAAIMQDEEVTPTAAANGITPQTIKRGIQDIMGSVADRDSLTIDPRDPMALKRLGKAGKGVGDTSAPFIGHNIKSYIADLEKQMRDAASNLEFEEAGRIRDEIRRLQETELLIADDPMARQEAVRGEADDDAGQGRDRGDGQAPCRGSVRRRRCVVQRDGGVRPAGHLPANDDHAEDAAEPQAQQQLRERVAQGHPATMPRKGEPQLRAFCTRRGVRRRGPQRARRAARAEPGPAGRGCA